MSAVKILVFVLTAALALAGSNTADAGDKTPAAKRAAEGVVAGTTDGTGGDDTAYLNTPYIVRVMPMDLPALDPTAFGDWESAVIAPLTVAAGESKPAP